MNTLTRSNCFLERDSDNEIIFSDLEFGFPKKQLNEIQRLHNSGTHYKDIAQKVKRNPYEVVLALLHMVKVGRKIRPIMEVIK